MMEEVIIADSVTAILRGQTLLYPTDTIWGIGCDAGNSLAIERLYAIKGRDRSKSMLVLVAQNMLTSEGVRLLTECSTDGRPTTVVMPQQVWQQVLKVDIAPLMVADDGSLGVRLPHHHFCEAVISRANRALVSTSANLSGQASPSCFADIDAHLRNAVDFCVPDLPSFVSSNNRGSRIVKLDLQGHVTVIRP
ncbi:MAG: L-threonylcarbamoyladenylate synthase [Bacteroidales bacterium]|nr:L-threonylcarbamoyladenylate synthase [Bacteroidales bacterium]